MGFPAAEIHRSRFPPKSAARNPMGTSQKTAGRLSQFSSPSFAGEMEDAVLVARTRHTQSRTSRRPSRSADTHKRTKTL